MLNSPHFRKVLEGYRAYERFRKVWTNRLEKFKLSPPCHIPVDQGLGSAVADLKRRSLAPFANWGRRWRGGISERMSPV
jgi:hypothetical protein